MNKTTHYTPNYQLYLANRQAQESKKTAVLALAVAVAAGAVIGAFSVCGIDFALLMHSVNSTKFYIMAGVSTLLSTLSLLIGTGCAKKILTSSEEQDNRLERDLLASYS